MERRNLQRKFRYRSARSNLMRATILEHSVYDKQVDAFRGQLNNLFNFLETWDKLVEEPPRDRSCSVARITRNGETPVLTRGMSFQKRLLRPISIEEELQLRLRRMTLILENMKNACSKEKEQKYKLFVDVRECEQNCSKLVEDMILHFQNEIGLLQRRLLAAEDSLDDSEQEKRDLKCAYNDVISFTSKTVERLEMQLEKSETRIIELETLLDKQKQEIASNELHSRNLFQEKSALFSKIELLDKQLKDMSRNMKETERAQEHMKKLFDIAITKLKMYEGDSSHMVFPFKDKFLNRFNMLSYMSMDSVNTEADLKASGMNHNPQTSDSMSVTSYDTTSEISLSLGCPGRNSYDEKSSAKNPTPSPKLAPEKKKRRPSRFKFSLRRTMSIESTLDDTTPRLPPISDEISCTESIDGVSLLSPGADSVNSCSFDGPFENGEALQEAIMSRKRSDSDCLSYKANQSPDNAGSKPDRLPSKSVKRTTSFANLKPGKNSLFSFAKDIEQKIRKKRRSKTVDASAISEARQIWLKQNENN